jgi:hypothetical protein
MEVLVCPQCGGNDLNPFGAFAYKCEACGTILKEDTKEKPAPPKTHYVAPVSSFAYDEENNLPPRIDGSTMDEPDTHATKIILGILVLALLGIIFLIANWESTPPPQTVVSDIDPIEEITKQITVYHDSSLDHPAGNLASYDPPTYEEKGITIKSVELLANNGGTSGMTLSLNDHFQVVLKSPKGFTREGKKVFVGIGITVKDQQGNVTYSSDDINKTKGDKGEDHLHYKEKCAFTLIIAESFGFRGRGNYVIEYRVWDKKSKKEITGKVPVFVMD